MSNTTHTSNPPTTTRRTSITWGSSVKAPREGGPVWGADKIPRKKEREPSPEVYDEDKDEHEETRSGNTTAGWTGGSADKSTPTISKIDRSSAVGEIERMRTGGGMSTFGNR